MKIVLKFVLALAVLAGAVAVYASWPPVCFPGDVCSVK